MKNCNWSNAALKSFGLILAFAGIQVFVPLAVAQIETEETETEEVIELSPFEVQSDSDVGYTAANSLSGSRTNSPLRETAAAISVLTREFLDDINATDFQSMAEWSLNTDPVYIGGDESVNGGYTVRFRGLAAGSPSRNYFKWSFNSDTYNTERLEFARGPNGVLFGDGNVGGTPTVWTKRALIGRDKTVLSGAMDSFGSMRTTADINRTLSKRFALRLNLLYDEKESWRDTISWERYGAHLAGTFRWTDTTTFRFEGEHGQLDRIVSPTTYGDLASFWDGVTTYNGTTPPPGGRGVSRVSTGAWFLDVPSNPDLGYTNWTQSYQTIGTTVALEPSARTDITNFPVLPSREFNLQPPDNIVENPYFNYSFYLQKSFSPDFYAELAYNQYQIERYAPNNAAGFREYRIDVNQFLPNGQPNPKYLVPFTDQQRSRVDQTNTGRELRLTMAWRGQFSWGNQQLNVIGGLRSLKSDAKEERIRRVNGPNANVHAAENIYRMRLYWDEPGRYNLGGLPVRPGYEFDWMPLSGTNQVADTDYVQLVSNTQLFDKRMTLLAGGRYDDFERELISLDGPRDARGVLTTGPKVTDGVSTMSYYGGTVFYVMPWIGLSANYSETFSPPGAGPNLIDGSSPGISRSKGHDIGFKLNFLEDRLIVNLNYYQSEQLKQVTAGGYTNQNTAQINRIWTNLGRSELADVSYRDSQDFRGTGYEVEMVANPTRNLRLMFNSAWPETEAINLRPGLRGYFETHQAEWQAGANDLSNPNRAQIQNDINAIAATLNAAIPGVRLNNTPDYTANVYGTYTFREGKLKNLALGLGGNLRGPNKIGATQVSAFDYVFSDSFYTLRAHVGYQRRFGKVLGKFQLSISNLLDNDDIVYTETVTYRPENISSNPQEVTRGDFRYLEPRKISFRATFDF